MELISKDNHPHLRGKIGEIMVQIRLFPRHALILAHFQKTFDDDNNIKNPKKIINLDTISRIDGIIFGQRDEDFPCITNIINSVQKLSDIESIGPKRFNIKWGEYFEEVPIDLLIQYNNGNDEPPDWVEGVDYYYEDGE